MQYAYSLRGPREEPGRLHRGNVARTTGRRIVQFGNIQRTAETFFQCAQY